MVTRSLAEKAAEGTVGLILEAVAVGEEQDVLALERIAVHHLPDELEDGECLAGARRHEQQHAVVRPGRIATGSWRSPFPGRDGPLARDLVDVVARGKGCLPAIPIDADAQARDECLRASAGR